MTDYKHKAKDIITDKNTVAVNISGNNDSSQQRNLCSYCNTILFALTDEARKGGYLCTKCIIEYWPNQQPVKKTDKFDLPGPLTDSHGNIIGDETIPIIAIDSQAEPSSALYRSPKLPASYEALKKSGFKWLSYEER